jgi:two-component system alkaline phosphatase synthesis response regulator PhoP
MPEFEFRLGRIIYQYNRKAAEETIVIGDISISLAGYTVKVKGEPIALTLKEYELLKYLITNRGRVYTRDALLSAIWGFDYYGGTRTVDVHIRRIRAKIGDLDETYVRTVRGVGYMFKNDI